tara:strand:- start:153 stop:362 length:210 start_codon:yes stop_codon:yes gene_type:complete
MADETAEEIAQHYSAAMDSVTLLDNGKPADMSDEEWTATVQRNKDHLDIMLAKDYWTDEDLTPFEDAVA